MIKSKSQQRLMYAAAQNPEVAKKTGVPQSVAKEFIKSTPKKKFKKLRERLSCKECSNE